MIEFLHHRRRRGSSLSWTDRTAAPALVKVLAGLCVILALICLGLAVAYRDNARQVSCYAEAAELSLAPPGDCRRPR